MTSINDPSIYLSQGRFHRSIICPRTKQRVTFALVGDWKESYNDIHFIEQSAPPTDIILFVLPSGCLRYVAILLDGIAKAQNVRLLAIDRPGAGGTPLCDRNERMNLATEHTLSVLEYLQIQQVNILTHSAGWFYALNLINKAPNYFLRPNHQSKMVFSSAFVPAHESGTILSVLPKSVISLAPQAGNALNYIGKAFTWSVATAPSIGLWNKDEEVEDLMRGGKKLPEKKQKEEEKRNRSKQKKPDAKFHPPYQSHLVFGLNSWKQDAAKLMIQTPSLSLTDLRPKHPRTKRPMKSAEELWMEYMTMENVMQAATEDFLYCLGKYDGMDSQALDDWTKEKVNTIGELIRDVDGASLNAKFVWGEDDFMIPQKGKQYLLQTIKSGWGVQGSIQFEEWVMADGGHDSPLGSEEVVSAIFKFLSFT